MNTLSKYDLRNYQLELIEQIKQQKRLAVWVDMGLGKTGATLTAIQELLEEGNVKRVLIVAPLNVANNTWPAEIDKWEHINFNYSVVTGNKQKRETALKQNTSVNIINKENFCWLVQLCENKSKWPYHMVVIDESSMVKSYKSEIFKSFKKIALSSHYFIELTGTPISTSYIDVWSQFYLLDQGKALGKNITAFRGVYFYQPRQWVYILHRWAKDIIQEKIKPMVFRLDNKEVDSTFKIFYNEDVVTLDQCIMKKYRKLEKEFFLHLEEQDETVFIESSLTLSNKLRQCASGFLYNKKEECKERKTLCLHDEKIKRLKEIIDELQGEPVIVAYQFEYERDLILKSFGNKAKTIKHPDVINKWNKKQIPILVCHPKSAAHGLNLQHGGHHIVWYSLPWSLELYEQLNARLPRMGQKYPVVVTHLISKGTIDEIMLKVLQERITTAKEILNMMRKYKHELTKGN